MGGVGAKKQKERDDIRAEGAGAYLTASREAVGHKIAAFVDQLTSKYSLSLAQRMFLMLRWRFKTDAECSRAMGIKGKTISNWKKGSAYSDGRPLSEFSAAYDEFFTGFDGIIQGEMEGLMGKAVMRIEEMLDAEKSWIGNGGQMFVAPDHEARFKAVQAIFHFLGKWGGQREAAQIGIQLDISSEFAKLLKKKAEQKVLEAPSIPGEYKELPDA